MNQYSWGLNLYSDYISHYGIIGMKWGERRYQNKDGSLTSAGRVRYKSLGYDKNKSVKLSSNDQVERTSNVIKASASISQTSNKLQALTSSQHYRNKNATDVSQKSNKELQEYITRKNLESQYRKLENQEAYYRSTQAKINNALSVVGDLAIVGGSAASMLYYIKKLRE